MTNIKITRNTDGKISKVVCDGHTNYGVSGEDIVCSAISSIVQTAVLGILCVVGVNLNLKRDEQKGFLSFDVPNNLTEAESHDIEVILSTMVCGISDLRQGYSDFIELEVE